jgi:hypothetical protein
VIGDVAAVWCTFIEIVTFIAIGWLAAICQLVWIHTQMFVIPCRVREIDICWAGASSGWRVSSCSNDYGGGVAIARYFWPVVAILGQYAAMSDPFYINMMNYIKNVGLMIWEIL